MTQKHVQICAYVVVLILGVSTAWAEGKKESQRELLPAPKCCCDKTESSACPRCTAAEGCAACAKGKETAETENSGKLINKVYPVERLVPPSEPVVIEVSGSEPIFGWATQTCTGRQLLDEAPEDTLVRLLMQTIAPGSWITNGGSGTVDYFPPSRALVVHQTADVQQQVAELLKVLSHSLPKDASACAIDFGFPSPAPVVGPLLTMAAPVPQYFAHPVAPPIPMAGNPLPPPCPLPGLMPPAPPPTPVSPAHKAYVLKMQMMQSAEEMKDTCCEVHEAPTGSLIFGAGVNCDAGLTGRITVKERKPVVVQAQEIAFVPERNFQAWLMTGEGGKEQRKWLLLVKPTPLKNDRMRLEIVSVQGKVGKANDGKVALDLTATPLTNVKVKIGKPAKVVLERDQDGKPCKWMRVTAAEMHADQGQPIFPAPVAFASPIPMPPVMPPAPAILSCQAMQPHDPPNVMWQIRAVVEDDQTRLVVRGGDQESLTAKSLKMMVPGSDSLKLIASDKQVQAVHPSLQGQADAISRLGPAGCFLFEGHVKLCYTNRGEHAEVTAERVLVNLADGHVEIEPAADSQLHGFWQGFFR